MNEKEYLDYIEEWKKQNKDLIDSGKCRKVFLECLPNKIWHNKNKEKILVISWKESIGHKIHFIYNNIEDDLEIINYNSKTTKLKVKYNKECDIRTSIIKANNIGRIVNIITNGFKIKIEQTFKDEKRNLTIIDREYRIKYKKDGRKENQKWYKYKCNKCGFDCGEHYKNGKLVKELWILESALLRNQGCSCCASQIVAKGINDIPTTAPWMIKYFTNGYKDAIQYTKSSGQRIYPICPDCGRIKDKLTPIFKIYARKSIGCYCEDGQRYPEKFAHSILIQLNINFETEYSPKWCKYLFRNKLRQGRYDSYFKLNNKKYIVEMDGGWHNSDNKMTGQTKEQSKEIDKYKDKLAKEHGIEVIRIDCDYKECENRFEYIKNNIINNSRLNEIFDFNKINWVQCEESTCSNLVKKVCELKRNNPDISTVEIIKIMGYSKTTIIRYLKQGSILGWCNYDTKKEMKKSGIKSGTKTGKRVEIFKDNISLGIFDSTLKLESLSEILFKIKLDHRSISLVCNGKQKKHKGFTFKYV